MICCYSRAYYTSCYDLRFRCTGRGGETSPQPKGPFIATQLNSTQLDVELSSVEFI